METESVLNLVLMHITDNDARTHTYTDIMSIYHKQYFIFNENKNRTYLSSAFFLRAFSMAFCLLFLQAVKSTDILKMISVNVSFQGLRNKNPICLLNVFLPELIYPLRFCTCYSYI